MNYGIICPSNRPHLVEDVRSSLAPLTVYHVDGNGYSSFSKLINKCITTSFSFETIIICADRMRPKPADVEKILRLLDQGYGLVCLYCFGFFGFRKDLIRKIGFMDERFQHGGQEDTDFMIRCAEANIAIYEAKEIPVYNTSTNWRPGSNLSHFNNKWTRVNDTYFRQLPEEKYDYKLGRYKGSEFLPWSESITIFPELKRLVFPIKVWRAKTRPVWTYKELLEKFWLLSMFTIRNWKNKLLRKYYER